jgi:hypothetical protein
MAGSLSNLYQGKQINCSNREYESYFEGQMN